MICDLEKQCCVARNPFTALSLKHRLRGMIGRRFEQGVLDAMIFPDCNAVHSMWMGISLDLLFLDAENEIVGLKSDFRPWAFPVRCAKAVTTIELPVGTIKALGLEKGDHIDLNCNLSEKLFEKSQKTAIVSADI